jgi:uncharacterized protein YcbX
VIGSVKAIGRFPVKSMLGEAPASSWVSTSGVVGDRTHGLIDVATGKVASAKDPRAWGQLLGIRAVWTGEPGPDGELEITCPDGTSVRSTDPEVDARLSAATGRDVHLTSAPPAEPVYDSVWEVDGIAPDGLVAASQIGTSEDGHPISTVPMASGAPGTFQDLAPMMVLTTASLAAMAALQPGSDWSVARFRPSLFLDVEGEELVEDSWIGRHLLIGDLVLELTAAAPRCVMTTLAQPGLPRDREILKTVARHHKRDFAGFGDFACLGTYASVVNPGRIAVGDPVTLD